MRKKEGTEFVAWLLFDTWRAMIVGKERKKAGGVLTRTSRKVITEKMEARWSESGRGWIQWRREEEIAEPSDVLRMTSGSSPSSAAKKETREPCWTRTISYDPGSVLSLGERSGRGWN